MTRFRESGPVESVEGKTQQPDDVPAAPVVEEKPVSDIDKALANEFKKGVRQAGKEAAKSSGGNGGYNGGGVIPIPGHVPEQARSVLDQVANEATSCRITIERMDPMTGAYEFIPSPGPINPAMLVDPGVEALVMQYAGGGSYKVTIRTPGYPDINKQFKIAGQPRDPGQSQQPQQSSGLGGMPGMGMGMGMGAPGIGMMGQGWGGMNPWAPPVPGGRQQPQGPSSSDKLMEHMVTMMMLEKQGMGSKKEDDEVKLLREQMQKDREEFRRQQEASERKLEELQRRKEMEQMQANSDKRFQEMVAMIKDGQKPQPTIADQLAPILPLLVPKNDGMADIWKAMADSQSSSSQTLIEMMKAQNERPGWDERLANVMGTMASMSTQMLQMQMQAQGGNSPWVDLLSQTIGEISDVFKTMFASGGGEEPQPQVQQTGPAQVGWGEPPQQIAGQTEPQQEALTPSVVPAPPQETQQPEHVPQAVPQQEDPPPDNTQYDLDADPAFKAIIDKIQGDGPVEEIAVRLYRHGAGDSGHPIAKMWYENPRETGNEILTQIGVPAERRTAVAAGLENFGKYVENGGDPDTYSRYVPARKPRRRLPTIENPGGELTMQRFDPVPVEPPAPPARIEPTEPKAVDVPQEPVSGAGESEAAHGEPAQR